MKNVSLFSRLLRNESGNTLIITAFSLTTLIGATGLGTDSIQWTLWKRQLQREADSAALAGAQANYLGSSGTAAANAEINRYSYINLTAAPVVEVGPSTGPYAGNNLAVRVVVQSSKSLPFSSFFLKNAPTISAQATAAAIDFGKYCVVSLDNTTSTGIIFQGSASINFGCGVISNSQSSVAVSAGGSSSIIASPIAAVGGVPSSSSYASGTKLQPYSSAQADPYASLPTPAVPSGCNTKLSVQPNDTVHVSNPSGVSCFIDINIKGTVTFDPGTYYIDGGEFNLGSQADVSGNGVTFILTSDTASSNGSSVATLNMNGGARVNLTAPSSGTYSGVLLYQDRRANSGTTNFLTGNSSSLLQGAVYTPSQNLQFTGNTSMNTNCLQLVAWDITFTGNSSISNVCPGNSGTPTITGVRIRLVS